MAPGISRVLEHIATKFQRLHRFCGQAFYSVSQKNPPGIFWHFFPNGWEFFVQILHACYMFLSTLEDKFLFN